jgi:hypothetical protein
MKTLSLLTLLLASCVTPHDYHLQPGQKFVDGEVVGKTLLIQSRKASNEPPEIVLFQDGTGGDFTIYER